MRRGNSARFAISARRDTRGAAPQRALVRSVFEYGEFSFGDGITRRSAKLAQRAFAPALARRGALSECRATP